LFFGPVFCGWICPFGTVQEFIGKIGRKIFKKRYNNFIPSVIDKHLRYLRYVILILVVVNTAISGKSLFSNFDPYLYF
jgi:polyferredoxin